MSTHSLTHSLTHVDYLGQRLFVKYFFKDSLTNCVGGSFLTMKGGVGHEKYNESVLPTTAFVNELKSKLPEFFNDNDQFYIYTRYLMTYNNVRMEKVYVNY